MAIIRAAGTVALLLLATPASATADFTAFARIDGSGPVNEYLPAPITATNIQPNASAFADASYGVLKAQASVSTGGTAFSLAQFADRITITTPGVASGVARGSVTLSGSISHSNFMVPDDVDEWFQYSFARLTFSLASYETSPTANYRSLDIQGVSSAVYSKGFDIDPETGDLIPYVVDDRPGTTSFNIQRDATGISTPLATFPGTYDYEIAYTSGVPFRFVMQASCFVTVQGNPAPASCDFGSTAVWNGLSGVFDDQGEAVSYIATSATGRNFAAGYAPLSTGAVPEPGTWLMMIVGFGLIGACNRRRGAPATRTPTT